MTAYYNENDPKAAAWLRELIAGGHIADGHVDERSIWDVCPGDLSGFTQCHFFAGIGGWSYAMRLAGWTDDKPVWTGSCPCQPFSAAGQRAGFADQRHLWPAFFHLIEQCRPRVVYGEQVASALAWLDLVFDDLEGAGYACRAEDLCAAGVGAPHVRQRLYWMAYGDNKRYEGLQREGIAGLDSRADDERTFPGSEHGGATFGMADRGEFSGVADSDGECIRRDAGGVFGAQAQGSGARVQNGCEFDGFGDGGEFGRHGPLDGFWRDADWLGCRDGKWRPVEPCTFPLAHGVPARVGRLRGYGNAIVPQVAAEFVTDSG